VIFSLVGIPSQKSWGRKKAAFYDADIVEEYAGRSTYITIIPWTSVFFFSTYFLSGPLSVVVVYVKALSSGLTG